MISHHDLHQQPESLTRLPVRSVGPFIVLIAVLGFAGCRGSGVTRIPPVSQTPTHHHQIGKFVWHDLLTTDVPSAKRFYAGLFGWTFAAGEDPDYIVIFNHARPIGGIVSVQASENQNHKSRWLASLSTKDVDRDAEFVRTSGGLIHEAPQTIPERGRLAIVSDPEDAQLVLLRSESGDPPDRPLAINEWMWDELWTREKDTSIEFYSLLAGYTHEWVREASGRGYDILKTGIHPRAGISSIRLDHVRPMWVSYIRVSDAGLMAERVEQLGGRVILAPSADFENGTIAVAADPEGGVFAMQKWVGKPGGN
ncbi:MAG: VOC family protein [Methylococcaceae bacterium]|nr:VOC family protein [Methylococcaceae bacterium]MCI0733127.1 VOC family protein [Methylococcaceae bacterium]